MLRIWLVAAMYVLIVACLGLIVLRGYWTGGKRGSRRFTDLF